jgi:hypothetical protein
MRKTLRALGALAVLLALVLGLNFLSVGRQAFAVTGRQGNSGISVLTYHHYLLNPNGLVIDIREVDGGKAPIDVIRVFFQIAEQFKDRHFSEVRLAYRGETRFLIRPERFQTIGREHAFQNPMYVVRTLPEDLLLADGTQAYGAWSGGWLGVMNKQMEDFTDFYQRWFLNDFRRS